MKHYCNVCGRQFVNLVWDNKLMVTKMGAVSDVKGAICRDCAVDLDENGLFPEERHAYSLNCTKLKKFTLIEVMVIIVIILILAGLAVSLIKDKPCSTAKDSSIKPVPFPEVKYVSPDEKCESKEVSVPYGYAGNVFMVDGHKFFLIRRCNDYNMFYVIELTENSQVQ